LARVVINNLQEGEIADENFKNMNINDSHTNTPNCNLRKAKKEKRKKNNKEAYVELDPMSGRNLLPHYAPGGGYEEDDYIMDYADCYRDFPATDNTTMVKSPDDGPYGYMTRKNSGKSRENKYGVSRSRDSTVNASTSPYDWEADAREKARARREYRHRRSKSGQWDPPGSRSLIYAPIPAALFSPTPRRVLTQSAPDLMELLNQPSSSSSVAASPVEVDTTYPPPLPPPRPGQSNQRMARSCTLGAVPGQRKNGQAPQSSQTLSNRVNSKNKIRC
jgi:hypothetical protein